MVRRYVHTEPTSKLAIWARRIAAFAFAASLLAIIIVRSGVLEIKPALATFGGALAFALLALLVAIAAFIVIWMEGLAGMRAALAAMGISLFLLAYPAYLGVKAYHLPCIYDITTDAIDPPRYGSFDFGTNASRLRRLMNDIEEAIRNQRNERPPRQPVEKKPLAKKDQRKERR